MKINRYFMEFLPSLKKLNWNTEPETAEQIFNDTVNLIDHGEPGVALENLCQNIFEYSVPVDNWHISKISALAKAMDMPPESWDFLKNQ